MGSRVEGEFRIERRNGFEFIVPTLTPERRAQLFSRVENAKAAIRYMQSRYGQERGRGWSGRR